MLWNYKESITSDEEILRSYIVQVGKVMEFWNMCHMTTEASWLRSKRETGDREASGEGDE